MEKSYYVYLIVGGLLVTSIFLAPVFALCCPAVAEFLYWIWGKNCHQIPTRSPFLLGRQLPVCWRCLAMFASFFVGVAVAAIWRVRVRLRYALLASLPLLLDGFTQFAGWRDSTNLLRFSTGLLFGLMWALWLVPRTPEWVDKVVKWVKKEIKF